jgi:hypothetical protein
MIVRTDGPWLSLITQPDHAALAAELMWAWRAEGLPDRATRQAALFATAQHDIGWTGFDAAPRVDPSSGRPFDFMSAPASMKQQVWLRAVELLPSRSTYAAALVAQHAITILRRCRADPAWGAFFLAMEDARDRWFTTDVRPDGTTGGILDPAVDSRRTFLQDYATVGTGDLLSLTFCNHWTTPQQAEGYVVAMVGAELRVAPDPFGGERVSFRVRARRVADRSYASEEALAAALAGAEEVFLAGVAVGVEELPGT